ncbi:MAG: sugar ABC transporter ATP-binding protein [Opitutaceae bacterium]|nr:sugar ABC transporter ATP-binding protein [Opitutaceae bacterium]
MPADRLHVSALRKSFGANVVLRELDFALAPGEIHALVGSNGAGKSTFSKILAGLLPRAAGGLKLDGRDYRPVDRRAAHAAGVVMVLQELSVLPTLSVAENLFLGDLPARFGGLLDIRRLHERARAALDRVGLGTLDPDTPASALGVGHQQLIEIAAGLAQECRVLILDEPTAALTGAETETLFALLRDLRARDVSILYISHRLDEIAGLADRVSVLRDGRLVATRPARTTSHQELVELMAGAAAAAITAARAPTPGEPVLRLRDISAGHVVRSVSLEVRSGEIVGLGGLVGAGRTELLRAIFGADPLDGGSILLDADAAPFHPTSTRAAVQRGLAFIPEDRKHHGLFGPLSVVVNASIARLPTRGLVVIDRGDEAAAADRVIAALQVRCAGPEQPIVELSGGNQQKVVIGRWLGREVRVWLLDEPTRGVDVSARRGIHALLRERAEAGAALLVASSDYDELAALCDRVIVLSRGVVAGEFTAATLNPAAFTTAAFREFATAPFPNN